MAALPTKLPTYKGQAHEFCLIYSMGDEETIESLEHEKYLLNIANLPLFVREGGWGVGKISPYLDDS